MFSNQNENHDKNLDHVKNLDHIKIFTETDLYLNLGDSQLSYRRRNEEEKTSVSWGQRKLLLTLIQFLTRHWDPVQVPKPVIVYAGAAPGINIGIVSQLFPEADFHLYDPAQFKIKPIKKSGEGSITLYQQYFTDEDAKRWAGRNDVYFISDIRTADYTQSKDLDDNESQITKDMEMQMQWYLIIQPIKAHLKFRLPYTGGNRPSKVNYLRGKVYKQPWSPQTTTETRLVPDGNDIITWDCQIYQDQMFHHNVIIREQYKYKIQSSNSKDVICENIFIDYPELLNEWDSIAEAKIWEEYLIKRIGKSDINSIVNLSRLATTKLTANSKVKVKDSISSLRSKPQSIKIRNTIQSRDIKVEKVETKKSDQTKPDKSNDTLKKYNLKL